MASNLGQKPILYSYFVSSCAWRVRNALSYKGIDYEVRNVDLLGNEQINDEFKKLNPMAQVPAFIVDGKTITQSISILEFIEETYTQKPLLPKFPLERAKVREINELIASGIQPLQNLSVSRFQNGMSEAEWCRHYNKNGLQALEKILKKSSGKYCVGDEITLADCCFIPQVFAANKRYNIDLEEYPTVAKIYENLKSLEVFEPAHPINQPDSPKNDPRFKFIH